MKHQLTPKDLIESDDFELLAEVDHLHIKQFIFDITFQKLILN